MATTTSILLQHKGKNEMEGGSSYLALNRNYDPIIFMKGEDGSEEGFSW
jgi:hypothetical protein